MDQINAVLSDVSYTMRFKMALLKSRPIVCFSHLDNKSAKMIEIPFEKLHIYPCLDEAISCHLKAIEKKHQK